jgi:hypothetical protein
MKRIAFLAVAALALMGVAGPTINPSSYVATATTTATSLSALRGSNAGADAAGYICNPTSTVLCVGGADVNTTTTAGGKCFPVCNTSSCAAQCVTIQGPLSTTYVVVASSTLNFYMMYGGWR